METSLIISYDDGKALDGSNIQMDKPCLIAVKPLYVEDDTHKMKMEVISQFFDDEAKKIYEILTGQRKISI